MRRSADMIEQCHTISPNTFLRKHAHDHGSLMLEQPILQEEPRAGNGAQDLGPEAQDRFIGLREPIE
jgi:hypothetical protein